MPVSQVEDHYSRPDLEKAILAALEAAGIDTDNLRIDDLAPVDEFHICGRRGTRELARSAGIQEGQHVLDVGCGIGGPARRLATEFGCRVTGLDLIFEYCNVATQLTRRVGLNHLVDFHHGNACELPFGDNTFDVVWTQHAAMNIEDKPALYAELARVLRSNGTLAIHDACAGPAGDPRYPIPWARDPATSFLVTPESLQQLLTDAGFLISSFQDATRAGLEWFQAQRLRGSARRASLPGIHLLLGSDFPQMAQNVARNLSESRVTLIEIVAHRAFESSTIPGA